MRDANPGPEPTLSTYQLRLPAYEGPLDVLLRLIERNQLAIEDVSLVAVTDQFLLYVTGMRQAQPGVIAEFTAVGARLTMLKSRSLLPKSTVEFDEPEAGDLAQMLREYKQIKEAAQRLRGISATGLNAFGPALGRPVAGPSTSNGARLAPHAASALVASLRRRLAVVRRAPELVRRRRVVSLGELVTYVASRVSDSGTVRFQPLVARYSSRTDVATAFLAVLILIRRQAIDARQGDLFGDIALRPGGGGMESEIGDGEEFLH